MSRLQAVIERQREYGLRDWLIGLVALAVVVFHLAAFSTSETLPGAMDSLQQPDMTSAAEIIQQHTAEACGDYDRAPDDLLC
jgi:hypothetical protein